MKPIYLITPTGDYINVHTIERVTIQYSSAADTYSVIIQPHDAIPISLASFPDLQQAQSFRDSLVLRFSEVLYL